jgi:WD40 repeat protein
MHSDIVNSIALSADGRVDVSGSKDRTLKVWDMETGREQRTLIGSDEVSDLALSADGQLAVSSYCSIEHFEVWDILAGHELYTTQVHTLGNGNHSYPVRNVVLSADGHIIASTTDHELNTWNLLTEQVRRFIYGEGNGVALSADGQLLAVITKYSLTVWDVATYSAEPRRFFGSGLVERPSGVALNADGQLVISALKDHTLGVWDTKTGCKLHTLTGHNDYVNSVALSADGRLAVSASYDKTLKVWNVTTGHCIATLVVGASLYSCAISADGKTIVAGDGLGGVHFLELVGADELLAKDVKIEKSWLALKKESE